MLSNAMAARHGLQVVLQQPPGQDSAPNHIGRMHLESDLAAWQNGLCMCIFPHLHMGQIHLPGTSSSSDAHLWIPVAVIDYHSVCSSEGDALSTRLGGQEEDKGIIIVCKSKLSIQMTCRDSCAELRFCCLSSDSAFMNSGQAYVRLSAPVNTHIVETG